MEKTSRIKKMKLSYIRNVMERASELEGQGRSIIHMEVGQPDFVTPRPIIEATLRALSDGLTGYGPDEGMPALRELVARKLYTNKGLRVDPMNSVIITVGATEAVFDAIVGLSGPGDSVIIPEPAFGNYGNCCYCAGSRPVYVPLKMERRCAPDFAKLEAAVDDHTRFLVLNNPHNPTGGLFTASEIRRLAEFAINNNLIVIADEIYEDMYYGSERPLSIAEVEGMPERTVLIRGFSKSYAMTGWRVGYVVAPAALYEPIQMIHQYTVTCACTFTQVGIANSLDQCDNDVRRMLEEFDRRRLYLMNRLEQIPGITYLYPEGAFYIFVNIASSGLSSMEISQKLLEEYGLALLPGSIFGPSGENYVRLSYASSLQEIEKAMDIFQECLSKRCPFPD